MVTCVIYFLSIFLFEAFLPSHSFAVIYEWVDASGIIHFSDRSDDIPLVYRNNLKIITEPHEMREGIMIPFEKTATGLILVDAVLNDRVKARMVFDTGANLVVITEELAKKVGSRPFLPGGCNKDSYLLWRSRREVFGDSENLP